MIFRCAQGHPIGIGGPGHHPDRAGPPRSGTMRQDRVKGEKPLRFCSPAHGVKKHRGRQVLHALAASLYVAGVLISCPLPFFHDTSITQANVR